MPNYTLTQKIHELLPQACAKNNIEQIEVEADKYLYRKDKFSYKEKRTIFDEDKNFYLASKYHEPTCKPIPLIETDKQIRQILVGLEEILGENPSFTTMKEKEPWVFNSEDVIFAYSEGQKAGRVKPTQAEALCEKWIDGLNPLFDRKPEQVLQELVEILEILIISKLKNKC